MRTHRAFPTLQPWASAPGAVRELVHADRLCSMRIEPVTRLREPAAVVDLHFADGDRLVVVPLIYLDLAQLDIREADPLVFPHALRDAIDEANVGDLIDAVFPELEQRIVGGLREETLIVYRAHPAVARARERGFFGAAPLGISLPRIAPALYARRFTFGKYVTAYGPGSGELAAFMRSGAAGVTLVGDDDADALAWYGRLPAISSPVCDVAIGFGEPPAAAEVVIRVDDDRFGRSIPVVAPAPADLMVSFSEDDGAVVRRFGVVVERPDAVRFADPRPVLPAVGGSTGKIALVLRHDGATLRDSDEDEAAALAAGLRAEGFTVAITRGTDGLAEFGPDLIHLFGVRPGVRAREVADWALEHRVPLAVHAYFEDPAHGAYWGALVAPYCFGYSADDRSVTAYLDLLAKRAVEVDGISAASVYAPPLATLGEAERVLRVADIVFVNSERERLAVEPLRAGRPTVVVAPMLTAVAGAGPGPSLGALTGLAPYVLIEAPIGPLGNQLNAVRAIGAVGVPLVLAGQVEDPLYAERVREFAGEGVRIVPARTPAEAWSLHRRAAVVADVGWAGRGHARLLTAAAVGASIVVAQTRWLDLKLEPWAVVDPADVNSIARGFGEAWDSAARGGLERSPLAQDAYERGCTALLSIVAAYSKIGQPV